MADLPGLIEGASHGEGLGDKFLRHIERTKVIAHVIDMASVEGRDPYQDYLLINKELEEFNPKLLKKPQIIIANKSDVLGFSEQYQKFSEKIDASIPIFKVSAATNTGLVPVVDYLGELLETLPNTPLFEESQFESHVLYTFKKEEPYTIFKESEDLWVIQGEQVEKLFKMTKFSSEEGMLRFAKKLTKMGIDQKLEELGAKEGDQVRILDFYFDYKN